MKAHIKLLALFLVLLAPAMAQYTPNQTFNNGATTAEVAGPYPACPVFFNWCASLNTTQYLWFFAQTTDSTVNEFEASATYLDPSGKLVTLPGKSPVVNGQAVICLTLPYPAALQSATIQPVTVQPMMTILFSP